MDGLGVMGGMADLYMFLVSVAFVSLSGVMMPGPVFAVTVAKGYKSKTAGTLIALGHGAIEFPLIFLIYFGLSEFFASGVVQKIISLMGGLILIYMGFQTLKMNEEKGIEPSGLRHSPFIAGLITTGANPYFFLWWATIGAALTLNASLFGLTGILLFAITHWSCDLLWDTIVSLTVFKSKRFFTEKVFKLVFGFCFVVLVVFGIWFILSAFIG